MLAAYDRPRDAARDEKFASGLTGGMRRYESAVADLKARLFTSLFQSLAEKRGTVVELGIGTFPNARFYAGDAAPEGLDIVGVDPNDFMQSYARQAATAAGLEQRGSRLRLVHGVSEALPFAAGSVDAVVSTLTLCSVVDPARSISEVRRVLRPGGRFLFLEHVLSETDPEFAAQQRYWTPMQTEMSDGCHFDRRTLSSIRAAGFRGGVDAGYLELEGFNFIRPTVFGIAIA